LAKITEPWGESERKGKIVC